MEMQQVRYFVSLCEHGSFARAAEACGVSQPALTTGLQRLEQELGGPLFHREGKRLVLSRLGQMVRPHIEQLRDESEAAANIARNFRLLKAAPLGIGVTPTIGPGRLAGFFQRFRRAHPSVELAVSALPLAAVQRALEQGEIDYGIVSAPGGLPDSLRAEPLYIEPYSVIFPPGHRLERLETIALPDVSGESYVDRLACELREMVIATCAQRSVELYANYRSDREDWVEAMVAAGLGVAFMPRYSVRHAGVLSRPLSDPPVQRTILLADVRGRRRSPAAQAFAQQLALHRWPD